MKRFYPLIFLFFICLMGKASQRPHITNVLCSLNDSEGLWWYGTQGGGLCCDDEGKLTVFRTDYDHPNLLRSNDVTCLAECRIRGELWFGTKQGAYVLNKKKKEIHELLPDELREKRINCILESTSSMWLAYRNQLLQINTTGDSVLRRFNLTWKNKNRAVCALTEDRSGTIWLALWNGGLCRLVRNGTSFEPCEWSRDDYCTTLQYDSARNCLLVETSTGEHLIVRKGETRCVPDIDMGNVLHEMLARKVQHNDRNVLSWAEASDSIFYIGTFHSLYRYDMQLDSLQRYGFETDRVRDIAISSDGTIYFISKALGVCRLQGKKAEKLCDDNVYHSMEIRGDTLLWLTDGIGNASTFDLHTRQLTPIDYTPTEKGSNTRVFIGLLSILLVVGLPIAIWIQRKKNKKNTEPTTESTHLLTVSEQEFLQHITQFIDENINNEKYGIHALSADMCMSRANLYRKLNALTGQSPTDFIRNRRLERAAELLRNTNYSVNEVADLVGFSYATYFTRCFKEKYGVPPKDFK